MQRLTFPSGFVWGTATAAHQVEGGNTNNDWWDFEHRPGTNCRESSGDACDSWHRWPDDVALCAGLGLSAYRFSLEWSRIEPSEGEFSKAALEHYRRLAAACRERGLAPLVTLHHFTNPRWAVADGGWESPAMVDRFTRFAERAAGALAGVVDTVFTLNEPNAMATVGWAIGKFPPGKQDLAACWTAHEHLRAAHQKAADAVRGALPGASVGLTLSMQQWEAAEGGEQMVQAAREFSEDHYLRLAAADEVLGVQVYTRAQMGPEGPVAPPAGARLTQMGYEVYPQALAACLRRAWEVTGGQVPLLVTENGIGTDDDTERIGFVRRALAGVHDCLAEGLDVRGYVYWSLLDNFEWDDGYRPTFGLVAVDRETFERRPKPSAAWFGQVARNNSVEIEGEQA